MTESRRPDDEDTPIDPRGSIRAEFDWSEVSPSTAVVETVAIASNVEPTVLEPLYGTVDPDALDALIRSGGSTATDGAVTVTLALDSFEVTVERGGTIVVRPNAARSDSP